MQKEILVKREAIESFINRYPKVYEANKREGVIAHVELYSDRAYAYVYEYQNGARSLIAGSRSLYNRWVKSIEGGQK